MTCAMRPEFERSAGAASGMAAPRRHHRHGRRLCADHGAAPRGCRRSISVSITSDPPSRDRTSSLRPKYGALANVGVVDVDVFNEQKALLAVGRATYSTLLNWGHFASP